MPIYEYRCASCGFQNEYLRRVSDPALSTCPECGQETFTKQLTAAGFQLKGTGWYVTDFRNNGGAPKKGEGGKDEAQKSDASKDAAEAKSGNGSAKPDSPPSGAAPAGGSKSDGAGAGSGTSGSKSDATSSSAPSKGGSGAAADQST